MKVSHLEIAKKEAVKLHAESFFQQAVDMLQEIPIEQLLKQENAIPMQGKHLKGAYEIKPAGYRGAFALIQDQHALIFAFFKKEGAHLKLTEIKTIEKRLKKIKQAYEI